MAKRLLLSAGLLLPLVAVLFVGNTTATASTQGAVRRGIAVYYAPGVFARVAANRHMSMRSDVNGYAAVPDCRHIGKIVSAQINSHRTERFQVLDCAAPRDYWRQMSRGLVIEVDWESAGRNGFRSRGSAPAVVYYP